MKTTAVIAFGLMFLLAGCQNKMPTASGKPEITVQGKTKEQVKTGCINYFVDHGFTPKSSDADSLVFEKPASAATSVLFGSRLDAQAWDKIQLSLLPQDGDTIRIVGFPFVVSNRGSAFERTEDLPGAHKQLQALLNGAKNLIEGNQAANTK